MGFLLLTWLCSPFLWIIRKLRGLPPIKRVLIIQTAKIGDLVSATPVIHAVRHQFPDAYIAVLAQAQCAPVISHDTAINQIFPVSGQPLKGIKQKWQFIKLLRSLQIDTVIDLNPSTAFWLTPVWTGIPRNAAIVPSQMGKSLKLASPWLTQAVVHAPDTHVLSSYRQLLYQLGIPFTGYAKRLTAAPDAQIRIHPFIERLGDRQCVGLGIAAANTLKSIETDQLVDLVVRLRQSGKDVMLLGSNADQAAAQAILDKCPSVTDGKNDSPRIINAVGATALDDLVALLQHLDAVIGADSGIIHCAEAAGIPIVDIFGPTPPEEQRPISVNAVCIAPENMACSPCSFTYKTVSKCQNINAPLACMKHLSIERVMAAVDTVLDPSAPSRRLIAK